MTEARVHVRLRPGTQRNEVVSYVEGVLKVKVAAPPVKGKANAELVVFLSKSLGLSRTQVSVVSGVLSRDKVVAITGITPADLEQRISSLISGTSGRLL